MARSKAHPHRQGRVLVLHALFMMDVGGCDLEDALANVRQEATEADVWKFVEEVTRGISANRDEIDERIQRQAHNWTWDRMARVDRNLLRIGIYELSYRGEVPPNISINEAVELAKLYGEEKSPAFINGVLDALVRPGGERLE